MTSANDYNLLLAKIEDGLKISVKRPYYIGFLDEAERSYIQKYLHAHRIENYRFWGGYADAERTVLGFFPPFIEPDAGLFPVAALEFRYRGADELTHRDFLGALMSLGVERSVIGDILPEAGICRAAVRAEIADYVLINIRKIGRVGVTVQRADASHMQARRTFREIKGVIASDRLDCMVALLAKMSREKAVGLIKSGFVMVNHMEETTPSAKVSEEMVISVRKKGRFLIDCLGPLTGKGRLAVKCRKYE